jgi:hypothetical protein
MSVLVLAGLMMAQAPAATPPPAAQPKKPKQICEMIEITGSRSKKRICRDENGVLDLGPGVSRGAPNAGMLHQAPSGTGEPLGQGATPGGN